MKSLSSKRRVAAITVLAGVLCLGACTTAPTPPQQQAAAMRQQQAEVLRATLAAAAQRDDFIEGFTSLRRSEPVFPAVKSSFANLFGDAVIVDWMVAQMIRDRSAFEREWGRVAASGMMAVDDATALKLMMPIAQAGGRMSASECQAMNARKASGKKGDEFFAMLRSMRPEEVNDFFEGMRLALRAGIRGDAPRPVSTPVQIAQALTSAAVAGLQLDTRGDSCGDMQRMASALDKASPQERTHMLNFMLSAAGLAAQGQSLR